jgi:hypothetical protein
MALGPKLPLDSDLAFAHLPSMARRCDRHGTHYAQTGTYRLSRPNNLDIMPNDN